MTSTVAVAFLGLGVMGSGMAANLVRKGFPLRVFNRSPDKMTPLVSKGAIASGSPAGAAAGADIVVLSLPATADVEAVLFGVDGIAATLTPGVVVVDTSTIDALAARRFAGRLAASGVDFIDAPISGGQKGAQDGTLSCMVGGAPDAVERARPVLEAFATTIIHVGDSGAGQIAKACNQICVASAMAGVAEAVALARAMNVDGHRVRDALLGGAARSIVVERHMKRLLDGDVNPGFRSVLMEKDIAIALDTMRALRIASPVTASVDQLLHGLVASGRGDEDWCSLGLYVQRLSEPSEAR
ncbi:NAD(P)-dependent oxidoreductase [uncultured Enterovirga sp.]|uniref:NAD(P)-dependent oxidoreductase n=1 Tax=uncultured Enterovirga sp. TaxID=2026352 RepID=UPI0035CAF3B0